MADRTIKMILCGSVEKSSDESYGDKVGVVSVVYVSNDEQLIKEQLEKLQKEHPENFYMDYVVPLDEELTTLGHYPSIEITKEDLA